MVMAIIGLFHGAAQTSFLPMMVMATIAVMMSAATVLFVSDDWRERWRSWLALMLATDAGLCAGWGVGALALALYHGQGGPYFYMYLPLIP